MGRMAGRFGMVEQLDRLGLLGPDTTYVHCCYFSDHEWQRVADTGGTISIAAQVETADGPRLAAGQQGAEVRDAAEPVDRRRDHGAGRHVHPDPGGVRRRAGPGQRGLLGPRHPDPRRHAHRQGHAEDGHPRRRARRRRRGPHRVAHARASRPTSSSSTHGRSTSARSTTRPPPSPCAPTCRTSSTCWSRAASSSGTSSCSPTCPARCRWSRTPATTSSRPPRRPPRTKEA